MRPVLFSILGFDVHTYGVSKDLAGLVAALLLARTFERRGLSRQPAHSLALWSTHWSYVGAEVYYLLEHLPPLTMLDFGGRGFAWYGGTPRRRSCCGCDGPAMSPTAGCRGWCYGSGPCLLVMPSAGLAVLSRATAHTDARPHCRGA